MKRGIEFPISTMPGEKVAHVYAGPMEAETIHFLECVAKGRQPLVTPEHARMVMRVYQAADLSAEEGGRLTSCLTVSLRTGNPRDRSRHGRTRAPAIS